MVEDVRKTPYPLAFLWANHSQHAFGPPDLFTLGQNRSSTGLKIPFLGMIVSQMMLMPPGSGQFGDRYRVSSATADARTRMRTTFQPSSSRCASGMSA